MRKLLKYLRPHAGKILMILCVLLLQAYCDLSLPGYTSNIVNIGIQQGGITTKVPEQIAKKDMDKLLLFVPNKDQEEVLDSYGLNDEKYKQEAYILKSSVGNDGKKMERLAAILNRPMLVVSGFESDSEQTHKMKEALTSGMPADASKNADVFELIKVMPTEQRESLLDEIMNGIEDMPDMLVEQAAVGYVKDAYQDLGIDTEQIQNRYIMSTGAKMLGFALLGMVATVCVSLLASRVAARTGHDLRGQVFRKVVGFSNSEFDTFSTASLITRSTNDIQQIQLLSVFLLRMLLYAPIMAIGGVYRVFQTNVSMSWIIALAVGLILLVVLLLFTIVMPRFKKQQKLVDKLNLVTREILTGLPVIRAFSQEKYEEKRFDQANINLTRTNLFVNRAMTFMMPVIMLIMNAISALIVWIGAHGIDEGQMQVGDMMAFITYSMQIIMAFLMICMVSIMLPRAAISATRVDEVLTSKTLIHDPENPQKPVEHGKGILTFNHVDFRYPNAEENVLNDITFTAKPGETTAIIGSTGSGKTTLINLIPRFFDVTNGQVLLDGQDIRDITQHDLRDKLGYVPQKGVLFSGTIASNIKYGNMEASDEEMIQSAAIAQAQTFIEEKSEKYESSIAQGGSNVSGGQKQRLSIARAIAKHPQVFIFDDSFSALDYKTDVSLRSALKEHTSNSTVIIVAQRISTILHAEQILVLDDGRIVGKGTHQELLKNCDEYYQIAQSQLSEAELESAMQDKTAGKEEREHE